MAGRKSTPIEIFGPPGIIVRLDGWQDYILARIVDGFAYWQSVCAECGEPFECWGPLGRRPMSRRCSTHAKPGTAPRRRSVERTQ